jgi:hypothetical protein
MGLQGRLTVKQVKSVNEIKRVADSCETTSTVPTDLTI